MQVQRTSYCREVIHSSENAAAQISTSVKTFRFVSEVRPAPSGRRVAWELIAGCIPDTTTCTKLLYFGRTIAFMGIGRKGAESPGS
jgi:hypothetical protein